MYQWYAHGNPSNYKTFGIGVHSACPITAQVAGLPFDATGLDVPYSGTSTSDERLKADRAAATANTYFEAGVFVDFDAVTERWGFGPDYVQIRNHPSFRFPDD